ncbi:sn--diacylglycerol cholinephosphotransferase [Lichtheimia corymbifera JMRC:FSU:9682]|uniref:Sn--diacylglycerol cholinephosphotransferase n=1 Tax=Lichtheimia corymbifera JMRC:FSU:9682 TaxID=1263082 RepID=A0A068RUN8_9FUNG|nr:sn--diacylglycerol cholinephosphotransferase [Lichtheimia corymbifera JMRC:FSU:9682]
MGVLSSGSLSNDRLANLKLYKYSAVDKSFISRYVLKHYWNWSIELFPLWIAPNLITLIGLSFMILNVALTIVFAPEMDAENGPRWLYYSFAAGLWLYSTFDNVDGKQARRTGTSSPLGELFDHGCDALNTSFAALLQAAALGMGHSTPSVMLYGIAMFGFYLSTAEEYHTGTLYLGYVNAPTEGVLVSCFVFCLSGYYGPSIWQTPLGEVLRTSWSLPPAILAMPACHAVIWWIGIMFLFTHLPVCLHAMYKACRKNGRPFVSTMVVQNFPIITYVAAFFSWVLSPYSFILSHHHYILYTLTTGIVFGRMATKIILAHLLKSRFPRFTVLLFPLIGGAIISNLPRLGNISPIFTPETEYLYICAYFVFALVAYTRWAVVVINSFCSYLGIRCLTIPHHKAKKL